MILEVETVDTFYGETQALFGASLAIERAKVFALLGPNGAGKTTMLRSILGLTRPRRGRVRPRIVRSIVVLPAPFGPSSANTFAGAIDSEAPNSAWVSP